MMIATVALNYLPRAMNIQPCQSRGISQWGLRQINYKHLPLELIEQLKYGFCFPICMWL